MARLDETWRWRNAYPDRICAGSRRAYVLRLPTRACSRASEEYWVYIEVNETSYGRALRQGRHGRRGLHDGQHAQQTRSRSWSCAIRCAVSSTSCAPGPGRRSLARRAWVSCAPGSASRDTLFSGGGPTAPPNARPALVVCFGGAAMACPGEIVVKPRPARRAAGVPAKSTNYQLKAGEVISLAAPPTRLATGDPARGAMWERGCCVTCSTR